MPTSKQARARQARQKERLAVLQAERAQKRRRFRRLAAIGGALVVIAGILLATLVTNSGSSSSSAPTTVPSATTAPTPTTTAVLKSAKGKPCVAMKGSPPNGAPSVPVQVGPPPTKLVVKDLKVGTGATATAKSKVTADYIGVACSTGEMFDESFGKQPFTAQLPTDVIKGWGLGIPGMKVGGQRLLGIPPDLAYGPTGQGSIAPDETLWFVIDLKNVA
jgi:peptidylprolyl isomerase